MKAHELARRLLELEDLPVVVEQQGVKVLVTYDDVSWINHQRYWSGTMSYADGPAILIGG